MSTDTAEVARQTSTDLEPYRVKSRYSADTIESTLMALAAAGGNARIAHEALKGQGLEAPPMRTMSWWLTVYPNRFQRACELHADHLEDTILAQARTNAVFQGHIQRDLLRRLQQQVSHMSGKDAATAVQKLAISKGVDIDKTLLLTDRPTSITATPDVEATIRRLNALKIHAIEATAEEIGEEQTPPTVADSPFNADTCAANARELAEPDHQAQPAS